MPRVVAIRAWYADGARYHSSGESLERFWDELPEAGVLAVMLYEDARGPAGHPTRRLLCGRDNYFMAPGGTYGVTDDAPDRIAARHPGALIKRGRLVADAQYEAALAEAMAAKEP